ASRTRRDNGSRSRAKVPSLKGRLSCRRTRSSATRRMFSRAIGGRRMYLQSASPPTASSALAVGSRHAARSRVRRRRVPWDARGRGPGAVGWVLLPQCGTGGDPAQGGGHGELGERQLGVSEGFVGVDRVVLDDALLTEQP